MNEWTPNKNAKIIVSKIDRKYVEIDVKYEMFEIFQRSIRKVLNLFNKTQLFLLWYENYINLL